MALDPISSLAVVGNVIQFVDAGCKLFSKSRELYKSSTGAFADDLELQSLARQLDELAGNARFLPSLSDKSGISRGEKLLLEISQGCKEQAKKLEDVLGPVRTSVAGPTIGSYQKKDDNAGPSKWEAVRVALRRMRKSGEIDRIAKRLDAYGQQLSTCLTMIFCDQNSAIWKSMQTLYGSSVHSSIISTPQAPVSRETNYEVQKQLKSINNAVSSMRDYLAENEGLTTWLRIHTSKTDELDETIVNLSGWLKSSEKLSKQVRLLDSLSYRAIQERQSQIRESHARTFEWVFDTQPSSDESFQCSMHEWQKSGSGIYWVSGKAGSGKSTLMKFLCNHSLTHAALRSWAGGDSLITASFFFWSAGTPLQKPQEGLLRSFLHEILQKHRSLIEEVFPSEWNEESERRTNSTFTGVWSRSQLIDACYRLANQKTFSSKFCFFIDGLDEYHADHIELVNLLCKLVHSNENVKILVSSRPWNVFQVSFGEQNYPSLRLEDLTRNDISLYVQTKLGGHKTYRKYILEDNLRGVDLVDEVVSKANGVFLWVYLVVRSLQRGLENEDRLPDLHRRLQALPTDLEDYFRHMLDNVDPLYKVDAAKCFDVALQSKRALNLLTFSFLDDDDPVKLALDAPIEPMRLSELKSRYRAMAKRLNARCQDLLEITTEKRVSTPLTAREALFRNDGDETVHINSANREFAAPKDFQLYRVDFLHRTVRDFLSAAEMREVFSSRLPNSFDSVRLLCASFVQQLKSIPGGQRSDGDHLFATLFEDAMEFARESEIRGQNPSPQTDLLDELECVSAIFGPSFLDPFLKFQCIDTMLHFNINFEDSFLNICVRMDLLMYVDERLKEGPKPRSRIQMSTLLLCALFPIPLKNPGDGSFEVPNPSMVQLLLDEGSDPNWNLTEGETLSVYATRSFSHSWYTTSIRSRIVRLNVIKKLFDHGATISSSRVLSIAWVDFLVMHKENWMYRGDSGELYTLLCELIEAMVSHIDVNICHKGCTVWGHFVNNLPRNMPRRTKIRVLRTIETFLNHGADPYFDYTIALIQYKPKSRERGEQPIGSKLLQIFTESELIASGMPLDSVQSGPGLTGKDKNHTDTSFDKPSHSWWGTVSNVWKWRGQS